MVELQKYQKLATEYSKLKAQLPVLKEAVKDLQITEKNLKEEIREKDSSIRRLEQELESTTFRNEQLSARVEFLQNELTSVEQSFKKKNRKLNLSNSGSLQSLNDSRDVFDEELKQKISENAALHKKLNEAREKYNNELETLRVDLEQYKRTSEQCDDKIKTIQTKHKEEMEVLTEKKLRLEIQLQKQTKELHKAISSGQRELTLRESISQDLGTKLKLAENLINNNVLFNNRKNNFYTSLDLQPFYRKSQLRTSELINQSSKHIKDFCLAFSNFLTYLEQRCDCYLNNGGVRMRLCELLHKNGTYTKAVAKSFGEFEGESNGYSMEFIHKLVELCSYIKVLVPYLKLSLDEENILSFCTTSLSQKNNELQSCFDSLQASFQKLSNYLSILIDVKESRVIREVLLSVDCMQTSLNDLSATFKNKIILEQQLPTIPSQLRDTNECILKSLHSLITVISKLATFCKANNEAFEDLIVDSHKTHPYSTVFRTQTSGYLKSINSLLKHDSVPYEKAIKDEKILKSSAETKEGLAEQVKDLSVKCLKLEQEKGQLMLDNQLVNGKLDKIIKKNKNLAEDNRKLASGTISDNVLSPNVQEKDDIVDLVRENMIKNHFMQRVNKLTVDLQYTESKCLDLVSECKSAHRRFKYSEEVRQSLEKEVDLAKKNVSRLKDELETITKSYEDQLATMSEHLANMNDKLAKQTEYIGELEAITNSPKNDRKKKR
ncbi:DgyrCDS9165 [Dimorphilus gyrociliatus]|uniref:Protein phosphatase 1 regulatory subunit 21 n=1 Tax=Dimorphilus gyrociliatus TaxID=2664684 RepID=A0A7I8VYG0_9ANNE|nr:DgyrCDS9165 [Dimorphilus gyrociliatus]